MENFSYKTTGASSSSYNVLYIFSIDDEAHKGQLKIGMTSFSTECSKKQLSDNCDKLIEVSEARIKAETKTAMVDAALRYTTLAHRTVIKADGSEEDHKFTDKAIHKLLDKSGYHKRVHSDTGRSSEWYFIDLANAIDCINQFKAGNSIQIQQIITEDEHETEQIILRKEQADNVEKTFNVLIREDKDKMLWDCKMRYGKTITAYSLIKKANAVGKFKHTIVITHRPAVEDGWGSDHRLIFGKNEHLFIDKSKGKEDDFDSAIDSENARKLQQLFNQDTPFIYFASIQDLRGSKLAGGKFDKNSAVFNHHWDLLIIDEAHEGTTSELGKRVIGLIWRDGTKKLELSGTPFEQLKEYDELTTYSWSYIDEQKAKAEWDKIHSYETNPYADLPTMNLMTFDIGKELANSYRYATESMAFSFSEFFRVWTGDIKTDKRPLKAGAQLGDFVHEDDVKAFLNLITTDSKDSMYPFSTDEFRKEFRHSFWIVPGVKEAKALKVLLESHPVFMHYEVVNVAGNEEIKEDALVDVRNAIKDHPYTITLSCGKLTTGVTVKEWTACFMLAGSYTASAQNYMQTIFRVQSPGKIDGKPKTNVYVFDFAPDRSLRVISDVNDLHVSGGVGKNNSNNEALKAQLGEFLNYFPVISVNGTRMEPYSVSTLMRSVKKILIEKAVSNGFEDESVYNADAGIIFHDGDEEVIRKLGDVLVPQKKGNRKNTIEIANNGLTEADIEAINDQSQYIEGDTDLFGKKIKPQLSPEQKALKEKLDEQKKEQQKLFSLLRNISIRLPLLFFGAKADIYEIDSLDYFADQVDDESWEEFMPKGLKREFFKEVIKHFFDQDVLLGAGVRIRQMAKQADELLPTQRAKRIVEIIATFKNPDKETVLTPWRVVNMHISDTLGGFCFFNEKFDKEIDTPRLVDRGDITTDVFCNPDAKILEINSKSGLYPLYMAFGIYLLKVKDESKLSLEEAQRLWEETVHENIFVLCKTPMAASITQRTLMGYCNVGAVNTTYLPHLIDEWMTQKQDRLPNKLRNPKTWGIKGFREDYKMEFDAVVGNPPYQLSDGGGNGASAKPIYDKFVLLSIKLNPTYLTMITPSRWFAGGKGLDDFRDKMLSGSKIREIHDFPEATDCFSRVQIKGGVSYFLWENDYFGECTVYTHKNNTVSCPMKRPLLEKGCDTFIRYNEVINLLHRIQQKESVYFDSIVSSRMPFGFPNTFKGYKYKTNDDDFVIYVSGNDRDIRGTTAFVPRNEVEKGKEYFEKHKVYISKAGSGSDTFPHSILTVPFYGEPNSVCNESYLVIGPFENKDICQNVISYIKTRFFRLLVLLKKNSQNAARGVYSLVPMQDFSKPWTDEDLYLKYNLTDEEISFIEKMIRPMA